MQGAFILIVIALYLGLLMLISYLTSRKGADNEAFLIGQGMLWGNIIGLSLCFIQNKFHIIKLNPSVYYLSAVPIDMNALYLILLNLGTLIVSLLMMIGPSYLVAKITPAKSIQFE
jgi:lipoprotein-releasing system permease protein